VPFSSLGICTSLRVCHTGPASTSTTNPGRVESGAVSALRTGVAVESKRVSETMTIAQNRDSGGCFMGFSVNGSGSRRGNLFHLSSDQPIFLSGRQLLTLPEHRVLFPASFLCFSLRPLSSQGDILSENAVLRKENEILKRDRAGLSVWLCLAVLPPGPERNHNQCYCRQRENEGTHDPAEIGKGIMV